MKKSFMTRVLAVSLSAAMAFSLSSATSLTAPEAATKKLPANAKKATVSLKVGKSTTLKLKSYAKWNITKAASNKKAVATAKLNKKAKATVKVTAKKKGTAVVTLTLKHKTNAKDPIKKKVTVKVTKAATTTDTTPTDTTPTDTTPTDTTTDSAVKVTPGALNISEVKATKVNVLTVSFSSVVASTGAVKFTVTKGDNKSAVELEKDGIVWNADANGATLTTVAKMTKGTYTVTATDGKDTTEGTAEVTDQEVKEIVFLNETALTGKAKVNGVDTEAAAAYVYYDVKDQYGQSMRETVTIQWSPSTGVNPEIDRAKGRLKITRSDDKAFTYGEKIYVTGVYTKTGVSATGTFNIGTSQYVDTVKFAGFLKNGTSDIVQTLPKSFKRNEYLVLYTPYDQNGCEIDAWDYIDTDTTNDSGRGNLTFISDNVLIIDKIVKYGQNSTTVNGVEYCAGKVVPGTNVNAGGTVNVTAISTRTGQKSSLNCVVGAYRILKKFVIGNPVKDVVADGETHELNFEATDEEGNKLTNFLELATQSDFSKLTFAQGAGKLRLVEKADGSAKLEWADDTATGTQGGWNSNSEDGILRPVSLTSVVVGGETSNQMLYVEDKARPDAIADVSIDKVLVNGSEQSLGLNNFTFLDQYGRNMTTEDMKGGFYTTAINGVAVRDTANGGIYYDNGFFRFANGGDQVTTTNGGTSQSNLNGSGQEFSGYKFGIAMDVSGAKGTLVSKLFGTDSLGDGIAVVDTVNTTSKLGYDIVSGSGIFTTGTKETSGGTGWKAVLTSGSPAVDLTLSFYIQKVNKQIEGVSVKKSIPVKVVTLTDLSNFSVKDLDKFGFTSKYTDYATFKEVINDNTNVVGGTLTDAQFVDSNSNYVVGSNVSQPTATSNITLNNPQSVKVTATCAGSTITVPKMYYEIAGKKLSTEGTQDTIKTISCASMHWTELYDVTSAQYNRKDATDTIDVNIKDQSGTGIGTSNRTSLSKVAYISDAAPKLNSFIASETVTMEPTVTNLELKDLIENSVGTGEKRQAGLLAKAASDKKLVIKDQYGVTMYAEDANLDEYHGRDNNNGAMTFKYLVKDQVENPDGYVKNNFKVLNNSTDSTTIEGAERGDTFTVEITAECTKGTYTTDGTKYDRATGTVTKIVKVTVGADKYSKIEGSDNFYTGVTTDFSGGAYTLYPSTDKKYGVEPQLKKQMIDQFGTDVTN